MKCAWDDSKCARFISENAHQCVPEKRHLVIDPILFVTLRDVNMAEGTAALQIAIRLVEDMQRLL